MSELNRYYAYKASTSGSGGGGDGCLAIFFAIMVCVFPVVGVPLLLICFFIDSICKKR